MLLRIHFQIALAGTDAAQIIVIAQFADAAEVGSDDPDPIARGRLDWPETNVKLHSCCCGAGWGTQAGVEEVRSTSLAYSTVTDFARFLG